MREGNPSMIKTASIKSPLRFLDYGGIILSISCALQCAAMPFLLFLLPVLSGTFFADELFEWFVVGSIVIIGLTSLSLAFRRHKNIIPFFLLFAGLAIILLAKFLGEEHVFSLPTLFAGGGLVAYAHWKNHLYLCRCPAC